MAESQQDTLSRIRKPRVHLRYKVFEDGAQVEKELPFLMGVMGDFSGDPTQKLDPMRKRKFVDIDRDNFNDVMKKMNAGLKLRVKNTLAGDGSEMGVDLKFDSIEDFDPHKVAQQVDPLKKLLETRDNLRDLMARVDGSPDLEAKLEEILKDDEKLKKLADELGVESSGNDSE